MHLRFCTQLYREQMKNGRYFVHEHPQSAASWHTKCMVDLAASSLVMKVTAHMCAFGMVSRDEHGVGPVKKPTTFMTNSVNIAAQLNKTCPGCRRHVQLMSGRAAAAAIYPRGLCKAVCRGTVLQAQHDASDLVSMRCEPSTSSVDNIEHDPEEWLKFWDDMSGKQLDKKRTVQARKDEIIIIESSKVWKKGAHITVLDKNGPQTSWYSMG